MKFTRIFALCGALAMLMALLAGCSNNDADDKVDTSKLPPPLANGPTASGAANSGGAAKPTSAGAPTKPLQ